MRWLVFGVGLGLSVLLTVVLWSIGFPGFFLFLLLPLLAFPLGGGRRAHGQAPASGPPALRTCPRCGWTSSASDARFCPRDGTPLT